MTSRAPASPLGSWAASGVSDLGPSRRLNAGLQIALVVIGGTAGIGLLLALSSAEIVVRIALLAGCAGIAALILSGNPRLLCLYGLVLATPIDMAKRFMKMPHIGGSSALRLDLVDLFIVALLAFQIRDLFWGYRDKRTLRVPWLCSSWVVLMVLGCGWIILGPYRALPTLEVVRMLKCLILFLVVVNELVRLKRIGHMAVALMCAALFQASIGLVQYSIGGRLGLENLGEETEEEMKTVSDGTLASRERVNRVGALLGHANHLAAYLALVLPVGVAVLFTQIDIRIRALSGVALLAGTAALLATLSRTGWLIFSVALTGVLVFGTLDTRTGGRHAFRRLTAVAGIAIVVLAFSGPVVKRLTQSDPWSIRVRLEYLEVAERMAKAKPVFGHGLNTYVYQMGPYSRASQQESVVHNNYALVWAEQGTVGLIVFLILPLHVLFVGLRNLRVNHETLYAINAGCLCGLMVMSLEWISSFSLRTEPMGRMYWMQAGLLCAIDYWWRLHGRPPSPATASLAPGASGRAVASLPAAAEA